MRFRLLALLIVLAAFGGCGGPDSGEVGQGLQAKLQNATHLAITYSELHGERNVAYEITEPAEVQQLIPLVASRRRWKEITDGGWSAMKIAFVEFRDSDGAVHWNCTLLENSIEFTDAEGTTWLGEWKGGLERVISAAKRTSDGSTTPDRP